METRGSRFHEDFFVDLLFEPMPEPQRRASDGFWKIDKCVSALVLGGVEWRMIIKLDK